MEIISSLFDTDKKGKPSSSRNERAAAGRHFRGENSPLRRDRLFHLQYSFCTYSPPQINRGQDHLCIDSDSRAFFCFQLCRELSHLCFHGETIPERSASHSFQEHLF